METMGVRFIPTDRSSKHGYAGNKPALCFRGEKKARCIVIQEEQIATVDFPLDVIEKCRAVVDGSWGSSVPYPIERFVKRIVETGRPMTQEVKDLLGALKGKKVKIPDPPPKKKLDTRPGKAPLKTAGAEVIIKLAQEWKLPTPKLRRYLRSQGLSAPYTDETLVRKALKKLKKGK